MDQDSSWGLDAARKQICLHCVSEAPWWVTWGPKSNLDHTHRDETCQWHVEGHPKSPEPHVQGGPWPCSPSSMFHLSWAFPRTTSGCTESGRRGSTIIQAGKQTNGKQQREFGRGATGPRGTLGPHIDALARGSCGPAGLESALGVS